MHATDGLRFWGMIALATTACGASASSGSGESSARVEQPLTHAAVDAADAAEIVFFEDDGSQRRTTCSGTLIAPQVVVTAAHCLLPSPPRSVHFGGSPNDDGATIPISSTVAHPAFEADTLANDIAVALLAQAAPARPAVYAARGNGASLVGEPVRLVGFGLDSASGDGTGRRKRSGATLVTASTAASFDFNADPTSTCFGDSGSGAFASIDGIDTLVGVTSSGDATCSSGRDVRVDAYADFLDPYARPAAAPPSSGCSVAPAGRAPRSTGDALLAGGILLLARASQRLSSRTKRNHHQPS